MAAPRKKADASTESVAPEQDPPPAEETPAVPPEPEPDDTPKDGEQPEEGTFKILNPGTTAIVYTEDGKQIAAGEKLDMTDLDEAGQAALDRGYIVKID